MYLDPTPLPDALDRLLESTTRISALVQPAFGLAPVSQHNNHPPKQSVGYNSDNNNTTTTNPNTNAAEDAAKDAANTTPTSIPTPTSSTSREDRGHKRVVRVRYDLNHARSLLTQLRRTFCEAGTWEGIRRRRKRLIEMRQVAAVLGAGALVLFCLEGALGELARLYEVEEGIRTGVAVREGAAGVVVGERGLKGKGKGKEGRERDVDVVRWMRHETRGEVWDLMKGVKDFGTAVWFLMTIFESPSDEEAATGQANLWTAVMDILYKENELSKEINRLYPGLNPRASRLETPGVSTIEGSLLLGRDTFGPSSDNLISRPSRPSDNAIVNFDIDDSDDSDSDSEPEMLTPTSSEFPFSEPDEEDSEPEPGYQLSLAPVINPGVVRVPIAIPLSPHDRRVAAQHFSPDEYPSPLVNSSSLRVLTVSTAGVDISPLPEDIDTSLPQRTPNKALSADAVFQLPDITDQIVLDFFRRALDVSRFAAQFANGKFPHTWPGSSQSAQQEKLRGLLPRQLRELCTDLYDELVRRNVEDQNKSRRGSADKVQFVEPEGFNAKRRYARRKFADMEDGHLVKFIALVLRELDTRCGANTHDASRAAECRAAAALHLEGTPEEEELRRGTEEIWDRMWAKGGI